MPINEADTCRTACVRSAVAHQRGYMPTAAVSARPEKFTRLIASAYPFAIRRADSQRAWIHPLRASDLRGQHWVPPYGPEIK